MTREVFCMILFFNKNIRKVMCSLQRSGENNSKNTQVQAPEVIHAREEVPCSLKTKFNCIPKTRHLKKTGG